MPYKEKLCGIYTITSPNGSCYVGSSININHRWCGHRSMLRSGKHHSSRLQAAWNKHGDLMRFEVYELCRKDELLQKEQNAIDSLNSVLNESKHASNVWLTESIAEKLREVHSSKEWKEERSRIAKISGAKRAVAVDCSNGERYESLREAANAFGVRPSAIAFLVKTQRAGRLGYKFKRAGDEWIENNLTATEAAYATRVANGKANWTKEQKARQKMARVGLRMPAGAHAASMEVSCKRVVGVCTKTGATIGFKSMRDAGRFASPENYKTAGAQICKVCAGVKKSAYGYRWELLKQI